MRIAPILTSCLLLGGIAIAESRTVEVANPHASARNVRITVLTDGKPVQGAKIDFYRYQIGPGEEVEPRFSITADAGGRVSASKLAAGHYHVIASAEKNLRADLYLDISDRARERETSFLMELFATRFPTREQQVRAAESIPVKYRVQHFRGVICDPSAAFVAGSSIEVVRRGSGGKDSVARLKADASGRFSVDLDDGFYIGIFSSPGFSVEVVPFEVTKEGASELAITLQVGSVS